jgi:hypothetical protein
MIGSMQIPRQHCGVFRARPTNPPVPRIPWTGARWYAFIIATHHTSKRLDTDQLVRWLVEVEHWSEDIAHELAIDYEFALGLLEQYDQSHS